MSPEAVAKSVAGRKAKGYTHSEATRAKIAAAQLGKKRGPHSAEHKAKIGAANAIALLGNSNKRNARHDITA